MNDSSDVLKDPTYGTDAVIGVPTDDLLPPASLVKICHRDAHDKHPIPPDAMIERLLLCIVSGGSVRPQYNLTIEQRRTPGPAPSAGTQQDETLQTRVLAGSRRGTRLSVPTDWEAI